MMGVTKNHVYAREMEMTTEIEWSNLQSRKGEELGVSEWICVDQKRIDGFAHVTEDHQFIHVDPKRAAQETAFGGTIAHGFLTLSLLPWMGAQCLPRLRHTRMGINYGFEKIRFLAPVKVNSFIRGRFVLRNIEERHPGEITMFWEVTVEIQGQDKPALFAEWLNRRYLMN